MEAHAYHGFLFSSWISSKKQFAFEHKKLKSDISSKSKDLLSLYWHGNSF